MLDCGGTDRGEFGSDLETSPATVPGLDNPTVIASNEVDACALLADHTIRSWGYNYDGQVGSGSTVLLSGPAAQGIGNAVLVAPGFAHTCAALSDGSVKCWGGNSYGQLGDGSKTNRLAPVTVSGL